MRVLAIVPAFNESESIASVLSELQSLDYPLEVVVVDDGSSDDTAAVAQQYGVEVLKLPFNLGVGGAVRAGIRFASEFDFDAAVQVDADGQHDPATLKKLFDEIQAGSDFVIGSRFADGAADYHAGSTRRLAMRLIGLLVRNKTGLTLSDPTSGLRAFSRRAIDALATTYPTDYLDSVESLLQASGKGLKISEVATSMRDRQGGVASNRGLKLLYHYMRLLLVATSFARTKSSS